MRTELIVLIVSLALFSLAACGASVVINRMSTKGGPEPPIQQEPIPEVPEGELPKFCMECGSAFGEASFCPDCGATREPIPVEEGEPSCFSKFLVAAFSILTCSCCRRKPQEDEGEEQAPEEAPLLPQDSAEVEVDQPTAYTKRKEKKAGGGYKADRQARKGPDPTDKAAAAEADQVEEATASMSLQVPGGERRGYTSMRNSTNRAGSPVAAEVTADETEPVEEATASTSLQVPGADPETGKQERRGYTSMRNSKKVVESQVAAGGSSGSVSLEPEAASTAIKEPEAAAAVADPEGQEEGAAPKSRQGYRSQRKKAASAQGAEEG